MHELQQGIVLRYNSVKRKVVIFDKCLGKIEGYINSKRSLNSALCNGSYIHYFLIDNRSLLKICDLTVIDIPLNLAKSDILFLHHILELCLYFLPIQMRYTQLFELVKLALLSVESFDTQLRQKLFLIKFFLNLGVYPENDKLKNFLFKIIDLPIDSSLSLLIDLIKEEKDLNVWIESCIKMNSNYNMFNTISYLKRIKVL